jgi:hypothetical protein
MNADIRAKRATAKRLIATKIEQARKEGRGALANMYFGYGIRINAGRYDDLLDEFIAELREAA